VQKPPLSIRSTTRAASGAMGLRVQLATSGKLSVALLGVHGVHKTMKLKHGTHTIHMTLPASVRARGTIVVKLSLTANGGTTRVRRAVLLPSP
jgi:hypothetical protein